MHACLPSSNLWRFLLLLLFAARIGFAQTHKGYIKGRITTADGQPVAFANVGLAGTRYGSVTDEKGGFVLKAPAGKYTLTASLVGLTPKQIPVTVEAGKSTQVPPLELAETAQQLNEIVVSAQKPTHYTERVSSIGTRLPIALKDLPQSVQVINQELIKDRQIQTVGEATKSMAGVNAFSSSQYSDYVLRGFRSSPGNFAYNGIRGDFYQFDQATMAYNLEKVEIMKGPASVLFSAGNPGGVINHVTKRAQAAPRYELELTYGSFRQYRAMADATGALSQNKKWQYRLIAGYENTGQLDRHQKIQNVFLAPQVQYHFSDKTSLNYELNYAYDDRTMGFQRGIPAQQLRDGVWQLDRFPVDFSMIAPNGSYSHTHNLSNQLMFNHSFSDRLQLTSLFRSYYSHQNQFDVSPGGFSTGAVNDSISMNNGWWRPRYQNYQSSSFLNYSFSTGAVSHAAIAGLDVNAGGRQYEYVTLGSQSVYLPNPDFSWAIFDYAAGKDRIGTAESQSGTREKTALIAGYVQDLITLSEKVKVLAGLRLESHFYGVKNWDLATQETTDRDTLRATQLLPRAGIVYQPTRTLSLYASYTQGFQPQWSSNQGGGGPFPPEKSRQYETGVKADLLKGKLSATAAAYYIQKYDVLAPDPADESGLKLKQISDVISKGIELSLQGNITNNLSLMGNYAYNEATTPGDAGFDYNLPGWFPNAPNHNGNLWAKYKVLQGPLSGLSVGGGFNHISKRSTFVAGFTIPAYTTFDASVSYQRKGLRAALNVYNLTNERYYYGVYGPANLWPGNPASFRLTLGYVLY